MSRHSRTKLVPPKMEPNNQELEPVNEFGLQGQQEESAPTKLDNEIECPTLWNCAPASISWYTVVRAAVFC